jgi:MFS family permease
MWPAAAVYIFSVMMTSICTAYYQFLLAQGIFGGISLGMTMAPGMAVTGQYFNKNRGAAMGVAVAGSSIGGVIFPIALSKMFANPRLTFGWTIRICGFIILTTLLAASAVIRTRLPPRRGRFFIPCAFTEPPYVTLIAAIFLVMIGLWTPFFYLPTYAISNGMSVQLGSYLISIMNGSSFFGRVIPGIIADRVGRLNMLVAAALSSGILILCLQRITTNATIILFSALYGFCSGGIVSLISVNLAQIPKSPADIGTYMGQGMAVLAFGALIGPPTNGALVSRYHNFSHSFTMSGCLVVAGGLFVIISKVVAKKGIFTNA